MTNPDSSPYFHRAHVDINSRNMVVDEFLEEGFQLYLLGVLQMHKYLLTTPDLYGYRK